jgi:hypothetical protein
LAPRTSSGVGIDVLDRYVVALGGLLEIVANFGDEQFKVG